MKIYGVIGWKNAGKTSLMERLVAEITGRGLSVSTVKHVHHDVDLDQPGKDTFRHRAAGAREVVLASAKRHAILTEHRDGAEPDLGSLLLRLSPVDLVLVEGYKRDAHPKVEVFRAETGQALIQPGDPLVRAVATDAGLADLPVPVLDLNDTRAVADFILHETGLMPEPAAVPDRAAAPEPPADPDPPAPFDPPADVDPATQFDTVVVVDWSASAVPSPAAPSADAIWIGVARAGGVTSTYHRTRVGAESALTELFDAEHLAGRRVLAGFDFPLGYPAGFAQRLTGQPGARSVWHWLDAHHSDGPDNRNARFVLANAINAGFGRAGPFWGRPAGLALAHLPETKAVNYATFGLAERRRVEQAVPRAQPVWKLYTTGSVGGQALTGLPMIARLSARPDTAVWPFDRADAGLVLAEVYPSLLDAEVRAAATPGSIKDALQVQLLAQALFGLSRAGRLGQVLQDIPDWPGRADEGWILGAGHVDLLRQGLQWA